MVSVFVSSCDGAANSWRCCDSGIVAGLGREVGLLELK